MIQLTPQMRILAAVEPVDFRKGIDGLARLCRVVLEADPFSGYVFAFINKRRTSIKLLVYDGQGFWLCQKRLSQGRFKHWPQQSVLDAPELQLLLWNGNPEAARVAPYWKKVKIP